MRAAFEEALAAAEGLWRETPALGAFVPWPNALEFVECAPKHAHVEREIAAFSPPGLNAAQGRFLRAVQGLAPYAHWRKSYTEAEVGRDFLNRYGWIELCGPTGAFATKATRVCIAYWGAGLDYARHEHAAEEIYYVVAGSALFSSDGDADARLMPGDTRMHSSHQIHAMQTEDHPVLTLVFWRGDGVGEPPRMCSSEVPS